MDGESHAYELFQKVAALTKQLSTLEDKRFELAVAHTEDLLTIERLTEQLRELDEAWRTHVGDGTDKLTPQGLVSLIEDYREEVRSLKEAIAARSVAPEKAREDGN